MRDLISIQVEYEYLYNPQFFPCSASISGAETDLFEPKQDQKWNNVLEYLTSAAPENMAEVAKKERIVFKRFFKRICSYVLLTDCMK